MLAASSSWWWIVREHDPRPALRVARSWVQEAIDAAKAGRGAGAPLPHDFDLQARDLLADVDHLLGYVDDLEREREAAA